MNPNTHIQLKQKSRLAAVCGVGVHVQATQKPRLAAFACDVGVNAQLTLVARKRAMAHSGGVMTPACRVGMDFGSTD